MKRSVYTEIDNFLSDGVILASSASGLLPSALVENIKHRNRFVVAHRTVQRERDPRYEGHKVFRTKISLVRMKKGLLLCNL